MKQKFISVLQCIILTNYDQCKGFFDKNPEKWKKALSLEQQLNDNFLETYLALRRTAMTKLSCENSQRLKGVSRYDRAFL